MKLQFINENNEHEERYNMFIDSDVLSDVLEELEKEIPYENIMVYDTHTNLFAHNYDGISDLINIVNRVKRKVKLSTEPFTEKERKLIRQKLGLF